MAVAATSRVGVTAAPRVAIVGATGGLGRALAAGYASRGARVVAIARDPARLDALSGVEARLVADLADGSDFDALARQCGPIDHLVFASGVDVRKALAAHTQSDIASLLQVNLAGPIAMTRAFAPQIQPGGCIAHIGGFADGGLAFPYYTVDVATRSGLAAFCEALTREFRAEGRDIVVSYLCPDPTDTDAERPFAEVWAKLGSTLASPEQTARFVITAVAARRGRAMMSLGAALAAAVNALSPALADRLGMAAAGQILRRAFAEPAG